jgi:Tol biopolymer transport system component
MKRALLTTLATPAVIALGIVASAPAANAPAAKGRIVYGIFDPRAEQMDLHTVSPDGSDIHDLSVATDPGADRWSPDGSKILVTDLETGQSPLRPATIDPDGSGLVRLDATPDPELSLACGAWSPDASRIACQGFTERPSDEDGIYTVQASDGGGLVRVTRGPDVPGDYSPSGERLVFLRHSRSHRACDECGTLFTVRADGSGAARPITPRGFATEHGGSWSANGRRILFSNYGARLFTIHPDGTGLHRIALEDGPGRSYAFQPSWSPSGSRILFSMVWAANHDQEDLFTARADGSDLFQVTDTPDFEMTGFWRAQP